MDYKNYKQLAACALGRKPAELVLKNARVLNVFSEELLQCDVAIENGTIVGVGSYRGVQEVDLSGKFLVPGFVDAHLHLESTLVHPAELVECALKWGTTTFIVDPHEAANVAGQAGIDYMLDQTENVDANVFFMIPSCVPACAGEDNGCTLDAPKMEKYLQNPRILGLGEVMDYIAVTEAHDDMLEKLALFGHKIKDGHAPFLSDRQLAAYSLAKIKTDHECSDYAYAKKQLRNGMQVLIREGSGARNLEALVSGIVAEQLDTARFSFCTDDKHISDIQKEGHISYNIRKSIALGLSPIKAYKMASHNTAVCYGLDELGAIAPGYQADFVVLDDLESVSIHSVYHKGHPVSQTPAPRKACPPELRTTVHLAKIQPEQLNHAALDIPQAVIEVMPGQITTKCLWEILPSRKGVFAPDVVYNKAVVVERHHATGKIGTAPVKGFYIQNGALATTVSHDSHNIVAVGDSDAAILSAISELERVQGGYTIVQNGEVVATLPLPVMGLLSDAGQEKVEDMLKIMLRYAQELGVPPEVEPFITLSFLALPVIPEVRVTARGIRCL